MLDKLFFKAHVENETERLVPYPVLFFKKASNKQEQLVSTLFSIYFGSSRLGHAQKTNCLNLQTVDPDICSVLNFYERVLD